MAIRVYNGLSIVSVSFHVVYDVEFTDITLAEFLCGFQLGYRWSLESRQLVYMNNYSQMIISFRCFAMVISSRGKPAIMVLFIAVWCRCVLTSVMSSS